MPIFRTDKSAASISRINMQENLVLVANIENFFQIIKTATRSTAQSSANLLKINYVPALSLKVKILTTKTHKKWVQSKPLLRSCLTVLINFLATKFSITEHLLALRLFHCSNSPFINSYSFNINSWNDF